MAREPSPPAAPALPRLLTIFQAAVAAGVSPATVRRRSRAGVLPALKLPGLAGAFRIAAADLPRLRRDPRGLPAWRAPGIGDRE